MLWVLAAAMLLLGAAGIYRAMLSPEAATPIGGPFELVDGHGRTYSDRSLRGRFLLMFFGYTRCADVCPATLVVVTSVLDRIDPGARRVQPLFVTVDPVGDTPERLLRYAASFSPTLIGLTGSRNQLDRVERAFHVIVRPGDDADPQQIEHSAALYLVAPDGRTVATAPADIDGADLDRLLRRYLAATG